MLELVTAPPNDAGLAQATTTLERLLELVARGDRRAFAELYDAIAPRVLGVVRRVLVDPAQSEEVAQEIFLEVWQTATRYEAARAKAITWVLTIAHRRAVDRVRASQASRERDSKVGLRDAQPEYDQVAEAAEVSVEHEKVQRAMGRLSELQRQAVSLAYYGGLSQSEVATELGVPLGTVKTRIRDAMLRLREELGVIV